MSVGALTKIAKQLDVPGATGMRKQELIFEILKARAEKSGLIFSEGVLETLPDGFGFLRAPDYNYLPGPDDIYVSPSQIRKFDLHTGDTVSGQIRPPKDGERYFALIKVEAVNFEPPERAREKVFFENLTPLYPQSKISLETDGENLSARVLDLMVPIGKGQRGLIVAPPRTGKTMLLQNIANSITKNHPEVYPDRAAHRRAARRSHRHAALRPRRSDLVDVRRAGAAPRAGRGNGDRKGQAAGRAQEGRRDPARLDHASGARLQHDRAAVGQGAVGRRRQQRPAASEALLRRGAKHRRRRVADDHFHGAGRHRVAAWTRSSSRSSRAPATWKSISIGSSPTGACFPSIDIQKSGTRKEELLLPKEDLNRVWVLRKVLTPLSPVEAMELLLSKMAKTKTNSDFLSSMSNGKT